MGQTGIRATANGIFIVFLFLETFLNRNFNYLSFRIGPAPLYITEIFLLFLLCLTTVLFFLERGGGCAWDNLERWFIVLLGGFGILLIVKVWPIWHSAAGIDADIFRHGALGYYAGFAFISFVLSRQHPEAIRRFVLAFVWGSILTLPVFILSQWQLLGGKLADALTNYHGLPALMCIGALAIALCAVCRVNFFVYPLWSLVFIACCLTDVFFGSRGLIVSLVCSLGLTIACLSLTINKKEWISLIVSLFMIVCSTHFRNLVMPQTKAAQSIAAAWDSWKTFPRAVALWYKPRSPTTPIKITQPSTAIETTHIETRPNVPMPKLRKPILKFREPIVYLNADRTLALSSPVLTQTYANYRFSNADNNVVWRLELWRLALHAVSKNFPVLGFPLATNVSYYSFEDISYNETVDFHNSFVSFAFRFGVLGLLWDIAIVGIVFFCAWRSYTAQNNRYSLACAMAIFFILALSCFNVLLESPYGGPVFWSLIGICMALAQQTHPHREHS